METALKRKIKAETVATFVGVLVSILSGTFFLWLRGNITIYEYPEMSFVAFVLFTVFNVSPGLFSDVLFAVTFGVTLPFIMFLCGRYLFLYLFRNVKLKSIIAVLLSVVLSSSITSCLQYLNTALGFFGGTLRVIYELIVPVLIYFLCLYLIGRKKSQASVKNVKVFIAKTEVFAFVTGVLIAYVLVLVFVFSILIFGGSNEMSPLETLLSFALYASPKDLFLFFVEMPLLSVLPFACFVPGYFLFSFLLKNLKHKSKISILSAVALSAVIFGLIDVFSTIKEVDSAVVSAVNFLVRFITTILALIIPVLAWSLYRRLKLGRYS